jgi:hypothetical protein
MYYNLCLLLFLKVAWAGERTRDLLFSFIFSFHHFTAEQQWLPMYYNFYAYSIKELSILFYIWCEKLAACLAEQCSMIFCASTAVFVLENLHFWWSK